MYILPQPSERRGGEEEKRGSKSEKSRCSRIANTCESGYCSALLTAISNNFSTREKI